MSVRPRPAGKKEAYATGRSGWHNLRQRCASQSAERACRAACWCICACAWKSLVLVRSFRFTRFTGGGFPPVLTGTRACTAGKYCPWLWSLSTVDMGQNCWRSLLRVGIQRQTTCPFFGIWLIPYPLFIDNGASSS